MQPDKTFHQYFHFFHPEWYETHDRYRPGDELLSVVRAVVPPTWKVLRANKWFNVHPDNTQLPKHGWKIHVSAVPANCEDILRITARICCEMQISFKFTLDKRFVRIMLSKIWAREGCGKFITIYPRDEDQFRELIEILYGALQDFTGSYILSDRRYKDSRVVYYRYGGIVPFSILTPTGDRAMMLEAPDGTIVPDWRTPYWNPPTWVTDPFAPEESEDDEGEALLKEGRYRIDGVLTFSASGGVYRATDLQSNRPVVIKEARPATNVDEQDIDAVERLRKEYRVLQKLQGTGLVPEALDFFQDWEHVFLVEEYLEGTDLGLVMTVYNPLIRVFPEQQAKDAHVALLRKVWTKLARGLLVMHEKGIVFGDFSIKNAIVTDMEQGDVRFIDFESAWEEGIDQPSDIVTPGYASPVTGVETGKADDIYGLGAVMLGSLFLINSLVALDPSKLSVFSEILSAELGVPEQIQAVIEQCMSEKAADRPTPQYVISVLNEAPTQRKSVLLADKELIPQKELRATISGIVDYICASADLFRNDRLFPADPMVFLTNPLSLAYGATGVVYALTRLEGPVSPKMRSWILERPASPDFYPPSLYVGSSGIAWALWEADMQDAALQTLRAANKHPLLWHRADLFYGAAGYGLACLRFYLATREQEHLDHATEVGEWLLRTKQENELGNYYWPDNEGNTWVGYTRGSSGIALYLLYLSIATGEQRFLEAGNRALRFELSRLQLTSEGLLTTPRGIVGETAKVLTHYWFDGSAGVIIALVRFWAYTRNQEYRDVLDILAPDIMRKYTVFPGLFKGLAGLGNSLLDLADFTGDESYRQAAHRTASGLLLHRIQRPQGLAFPGEQALRISTDFGTGSAGIALFLDRLARQEQRPGDFNFTLDSLFSTQNHAQQNESLIRGQAPSLT